MQESKETVPDTWRGAWKETGKHQHQVRMSPVEELRNVEERTSPRDNKKEMD